MADLFNAMGVPIFLDFYLRLYALPKESPNKDMDQKIKLKK